MSRKTRICHNRKVNRLLKNALTPCLQVSELQSSETAKVSWLSNCLIIVVVIIALKSKHVKGLPLNQAFDKLTLRNFRFSFSFLSVFT